MLRPITCLSLLLACTAAWGCTDHDSTIWITFLPAPAVEDGSCVASDTAIATGSWSMSAPRAYGAFVRIRNQIRANGRDISNDPNWVQMEYLDITLLSPDGQVLDIAANPYRIPIGSTVPSASAPDSPGEATPWSVIVPLPYREALEGLAENYVIAAVRPIGRTLGGTDVEGPEYVWPIYLDPEPVCQVCPEDAGARDTCSPGQDGGCFILTSC